MRISDWSSDVCSSDLRYRAGDQEYPLPAGEPQHAVQIEQRPGDQGARAVADRAADREHAHAPREIRPRKPESDVENQARIEPRFRRAEQEAQDVEHLRSEEHTSELQSLMRNSYAVFC